MFQKQNALNRTPRPRTESQLFRGWVLCLLVLAVWGLCGVPYAAAAVPQAYEKARADMDRLTNDARKSHWRAPWQELAADFMTVYATEKTWRNRPAALYRSALALDELARRSSVRKDAQQAEARYMLLVRQHTSSVLADDALFKAAQLQAEILDDTPKALERLHNLQSHYAGSDTARKAARYAATLSAAPAAKVNKAPRDKKVVASRTSKAVSAEKKRPRNTSTSSAAGRSFPPVRTVLIDAGHGGRDPGTRHNGIVERTITLDLAKRVGAILAAHGLSARYTRFSNEGMSLDERTDKVRTQKADIFLSIHVNAHALTSVQGFETYYLDIARTSEASRLAAVENALAGRARGKMPIARLLGMQNQESRRLARAVHKNTLAFVRKKKYAIRDGGIKTAPFQVLRKAGVPGILIEAGYCTHLKEAKSLASPAYRAALARGIATGILTYAKRK